MKDLIIADITSLKKNETGFGHFFRVADMYQELFATTAKVIVAGGPIYKTHYNDFLELKYDVDLKEHKNLFSRIKSKIKEISNCIELLNKINNSIIVFQYHSTISLFLGLILKKSNNKIFIIQYRTEIERTLPKILFYFARKRIDGVLCSKKEIGEKYKLPYLVVPDYIYTKEDLPERQNKFDYDFGVFGIIREGKDVVGVAKQIVGTTKTLVIAGSIQSDIMREQLNEIAKNNQNIFLIDKYLTDEEYQMFIKKTRYVVLPYNGDYYKNSSSGVIYDVLFSGIPVIIKNYEIFDIVKKYGVGILYNELNDLNFDNLDDSKYEVMCKNINKLILDNKNFKNECSDFINV